MKHTDFYQANFFLNSPMRLQSIDPPLLGNIQNRLNNCIGTGLRVIEPARPEITHHRRDAAGMIDIGMRKDQPVDSAYPCMPQIAAYHRFPEIETVGAIFLRMRLPNPAGIKNPHPSIRKSDDRGVSLADIQEREA